MLKTDKIFVAGAAGMVGSAIIRALLKEGFTNIIGSVHASKPGLARADSKNLRLVKLDLCNQADCASFFAKEPPQAVFAAAARVGGIKANNTYPAQFIYDNLSIQNNLIHFSYKAGVDRLLFLGSSCIYPRLAKQPMQEDQLLCGELEPTNEPYALAKIAGIKMCEAYNREYKTRFAALMPTNLYGPGDNFHPENSHVLPALLNRFHKAKVDNRNEVVVWGSGQVMREFLHVDDMAAACLYVMNLDDDIFARNFLSYPKPCFVNLGTGTDVSIAKLATIIAEAVRFKGKISFDKSKPDGTPKKLLDITRLKNMGWEAEISLEKGIADTYKWYLDNIKSLRTG